MYCSHQYPLVQENKFHFWITFWMPWHMSSCTCEEQVTLHIDNCMWFSLFHKWKLKLKFFEVPRDFPFSYTHLSYSLSRSDDTSRVKSIVKFRIFPMSFHLWNHLKVTHPQVKSLEKFRIFFHEFSLVKI